VYARGKSMSDKSRINNEYDVTYKSFLTHKQTFLELLKGFVCEDWVDQVSEDDLSLENQSFILYDYQERESDIIYKAKLNEQEVYFFILLEMQSTVDYTMPFRLLIYMTELWKRFFADTNENERKRKNFRLPAIVPMVLYNGTRRWTAVKNFLDYQDGQECFTNNLLGFRYILFDINSYSESELYEIGTLISSVFLLDQNINHEEWIKRFYNLITIVKKFTPEQFVKFKRWVYKISHQNVPDTKHEELSKIIEEADQLEVEQMVMNLEANMKKWMSEAEKKGRQEGIKEGLYVAAKALIKSGKTIEETSSLLELPESIIDRIKKEQEDLA
jgi:predicted transposase/invertase (TIGR01784 family)